MTVNRISQLHRYVGTSGDSKPSDVPSGSTFFETNTGDGYVYTGAAWVKDSESAHIAAILAAGEITTITLSLPGALPSYNPSADNTPAGVSEAVSRLHTLEVSNPNEVDLYIQFFNEVAGSVTVGKTPVVAAYIVPAASGSIHGVTEKTFQAPIEFDVAMSYAVTDAPTGGNAPDSGVAVTLTYSEPS